MPLVVRRLSENESWRECVARYALKGGLLEECLDFFDDAVKNGEEENIAAFNALYEWDCTDYEDDDGNPIKVTVEDADEEPTLS